MRDTSLFVQKVKDLIPTGSVVMRLISTKGSYSDRQRALKWVLLVTVPRTVLDATASLRTASVRQGHRKYCVLVLRTHPVGSVVWSSVSVMMSWQYFARYNITTCRMRQRILFRPATCLEMGLANDAANLEMGPGNDAGASTDCVRQPGPKEVSTDCVRQARPQEVLRASAAHSSGRISSVANTHLQFRKKDLIPTGNALRASAAHSSGRISSVEAFWKQIHLR
jgi:hypothetical protein